GPARAQARAAALGHEGPSLRPRVPRPLEGSPARRAGDGVQGRRPLRAGGGGRGGAGGRDPRARGGRGGRQRCGGGRGGGGVGGQGRGEGERGGDWRQQGDDAASWSGVGVVAFCFGVVVRAGGGGVQRGPRAPPRRAGR